jgi:hypothetical protein
MSEAYIKLKARAGDEIVMLYRNVLETLEDVRDQANNADGDFESDEGDHLRLVTQYGKRYWFLRSAKEAIYHPVLNQVNNQKTLLKRKFHNLFQCPFPEWLFFPEENHWGNKVIDIPANVPPPYRDFPYTDFRNWHTEHEHVPVFKCAGIYLNVLDNALQQLRDFFQQAVTLGGHDQYLEFDHCLEVVDQVISDLNGACEDLHNDSDVPNYVGDLCAKANTWDPNNEQDMDDAIKQYRSRYGYERV